MIKILVIHGPNLDLLGKREPEIYGKVTLKQINSALRNLAKSKRVKLRILQSNHEGEIVSVIGKAKDEFDAVLINPAAYTHTSVAIRDAILASNLPAIEVHLSNIYAREKWRAKSVIASTAKGQISGLGWWGYVEALRTLVGELKKET